MQRGERPFARTVQVAVSDRLEEHQIRGRLPHNMRTIEALLIQNEADYLALVTQVDPPRQRRAKWRRLIRRRRRVVRLVEELGVRTELIEPQFQVLLELNHRLSELASASASGSKEDMETERARILEKVQQTSGSLPRRIRRLRRTLEQHRQAKMALCEGNLRLVVSIAKKYRNRGIAFLDLIQEGNAGLMRAIEKFEYRRGFKFCTYATWWIRQAVSRAVSDQSRTIRVPVHAASEMSKVLQASQSLYGLLEREPSVEETSQATGITTEMTTAMLAMSRAPVSLEHVTGRDDDTTIVDLFQDEAAPEPATLAGQRMLRERVDDLLETLTTREREVVSLRYGLGDGRDHTLDEVGHHFKVTRERVRQIEHRALAKLQHHRRSSRLVEFLDASVDANDSRPLAKHAAAKPGRQSEKHESRNKQTSKKTHGTASKRTRKCVRGKKDRFSRSACRAIKQGVQRGDSVARLEQLGLSQRTIGMLEESKYEIISLRDLVCRTKADLLSITNLGQKNLAEIFACLSRYDELNRLA
jgi:RNA polymerase primary sigma factor